MVRCCQEFIAIFLDLTVVLGKYLRICYLPSLFNIISYIKDKHTNRNVIFTCWFERKLLSPLMTCDYNNILCMWFGVAGNLWGFPLHRHFGIFKNRDIDVIILGILLHICRCFYACLNSSSFEYCHNPIPLRNVEKCFN